MEGQMKINLLTTEETAFALKCTTHHVAALRQKGEIKGYHVSKRWMYPEEEIQKYKLKRDSAQQHVKFHL
jgi:hypothetical protein